MFLSKAPKAPKACRAREKEREATKAAAKARAHVSHSLFIAIDVSCHTTVPQARCASCHHVDTVCPRRSSQPIIISKIADTVHLIGSFSRLTFLRRNDHS